VRKIRIFMTPAAGPSLPRHSNGFGGSSSGATMPVGSNAGGGTAPPAPNSPAPAPPPAPSLPAPGATPPPSRAASCAAALAALSPGAADSTEGTHPPPPAGCGGPTAPAPAPAPAPVAGQAPAEGSCGTAPVWRGGSCGTKPACRAGMKPGTEAPPPAAGCSGAGGPENAGVPAPPKSAPENAGVPAPPKSAGAPGAGAAAGALPKRPLLGRVTAGACAAGNNGACATGLRLQLRLRLRLRLRGVGSGGEGSARRAARGDTKASCAGTCARAARSLSSGGARTCGRTRAGGPRGRRGGAGRGPRG
jgi:hypothetical protein